MCLGSGRSKGPDIQSPTAPEVNKAPPDESTSRQPKPGVDYNIGSSIAKKPPAGTKTWDDVDNTNQAKEGGRLLQGSNINI